MLMAKTARKTGAARRKQEHPLDRARAFAIAAARLLEDDKCTDITLLEVTGISQVTDFILIGSGTSERQMRSVLGHVEDLGAQTGFQPFRTSTDERASWLLADFVHVVVHLFEPNTRAHYDLEMLWGDAPRLKWQRPRTRAGGAPVPQKS
ncbi:MAG: ribosome silencing factor [Phycisphaerales bacterium]|nr:ribosome silencing factor [Phycisphaerales bacterium]